MHEDTQAFDWNCVSTHEFQDNTLRVHAANEYNTILKWFAQLCTSILETP